jgi:hypothetical protein
MFAFTRALLLTERLEEGGGGERQFRSRSRISFARPSSKLTIFSLEFWPLSINDLWALVLRMSSNIAREETLHSDHLEGQIHRVFV